MVGLAGLVGRVSKAFGIPSFTKSPLSSPGWKRMHFVRRTVEVV